MILSVIEKCLLLLIAEGECNIGLLVDISLLVKSLIRISLVQNRDG